MSNIESCEKIGNTMGENSFKFQCPHCGQHIEVDCDMIDIRLDCPTCGQPFIVPRMNACAEEDGVPHEFCDTPDQKASSDGRLDVNHCPSPVITVIRKRESFIDRSKNWMKAIGIGCAALLLFVGVSVIKEISNDVPTTTVEKTIGEAGFETKAVVASINCLLNFIRRPNDRRSQALFKSLESCPKDFQDAVKKYLDSNRKTILDFMTEAEEDLSKGLPLFTIRRGNSIDADPQLVVLRIQPGDDAERRREYLMESAKQHKKTEVENAAKHLIDIAEKYGVDPISLEDALLD